MKKILFYRYNSICEPFMRKALIGNGCEVDEIREEMENKNVSPAECMKLVNAALSEFRYDGVFTVNFYPVISEVCNIYKIP